MALPGRFATEPRVDSSVSAGLLACDEVRNQLPPIGGIEELIRPLTTQRSLRRFYPFGYPLGSIETARLPGFLNNSLDLPDQFAHPQHSLALIEVQRRIRLDFSSCSGR